MSRTDRTGKRTLRQAALKRKTLLGYYYVFTDTRKTEKNYLLGLKESLPPELRNRLVIKITKSKTENLLESCLNQAALEPQYGEPWIVFDRDRVVKFDEIIKTAQEKGINVGWSNPCIEVWFEAYFGLMQSDYESKSCCKRFSQIFQNNTGKEYDKADKNLYYYLNLYGDEKQAIITAEKRYCNHEKSKIIKPSQMCPGTTLHRLIAQIREKTESE